jgi:hypothetical protein
MIKRKTEHRGKGKKEESGTVIWWINKSKRKKYLRDWEKDTGTKGVVKIAHLPSLSSTDRTCKILSVCLSLWRNSPTRTRSTSILTFLNHTQWHTTNGRTPLDEGSARRRDFYVTTLTTDLYVPGEIQTRTPSTRAATDTRLRLLGHLRSAHVKYCTFRLHLDSVDLIVMA